MLLLRPFLEKLVIFDAITSQILQMLYIFSTNEYHNFGGLMIQKILEKMGDKEGRPRNIYFVRFSYDAG